MLMSREVMPRPDLRLLAAMLNDVEPGAARWRADPPRALTPRLEVPDGGDSGLHPDDFIAKTMQFLSTAVPAWDPFHPA